MADINKLVDDILKNVGGKDNIKKAENCMTRLRLTIIDESKVKEDSLKDVSGVMGVVHDAPGYYEVVVGPGVSKKCLYRCQELNVGEEKKDNSDWKKNKDELRSKQNKGGVRAAFKTLGEIFVPLVPAIVAAGLCGGLAVIITFCIPGYKDNFFWNTLAQVLTLIKTAFLGYLGVYVGFRTADRFGGTPALGGLIGMITHLPLIADFAKTVGFNSWFEGVTLLNVGSGGVIAAVIGAILISKLEIWLHKHMPNAIDAIATPFLAVIIITIPYVFVIMPIAGIFSTLIGMAVEKTIMSDNVFVAAAAGFVAAALFLPLVALGMHHALIPIYTVQLQTIGYTTLYPALCMGGCAQIGAAIAIWIIAKRVGNDKIIEVIKGALVPGILGVGEPLIYGVALPLFRPFITAGLAAGFGGAFVTVMKCAAVIWTPAGILGPVAVNAGPLGPGLCVLCYYIGMIISVVLGFVFTWFFQSREDVKNY